MRGRVGGGAGHAHAGGTYVLNGRCGMLLLGCSKHDTAPGINQLAGADIWGMHKNLVVAPIAVRSHSIHNALQSSDLGLV